MNGRPQRQTLWHTLPLISFFVSEWRAWREEQMQPSYRLAPMPDNVCELISYPLDMWPLLALPHGTLDEVGVPCNLATKKHPAIYHPTTIAQYALAQWNVYLATGDEKHRQAFMLQAEWLVAHESRFADNAGGWPIPFSVPEFYAQEPWLSALTQGNVISVLIRAYQLTGDDVFLEVAHRGVRTFELDIRDGGVSTSIGDDDVFFEEVAVYPAAHILNGYIFALFGLYDYLALTNDASITALVQRSFATLHTLIDGFDTGYWSRYDLLFRHLAPPFYHALHVEMLEALARYSGCKHCADLAARWEGYQQSLRSRLCYFIASRINRYRRGFQRLGIQGAFFHILKAEEHTASKSLHLATTAPAVADPFLLDREVTSNR